MTQHLVALSPAPPPAWSPLLVPPLGSSSSVISDGLTDMWTTLLVSVLNLYSREKMRTVSYGRDDGDMR